MDKAPKKINNLGNTCYLNSCIQILCCIPQLRQFTLKTESIHNSTKIENILWKNWKDVLTIMSNTNNTKESLSPNGFLNAIETVAKNKKMLFFQEDEQEDIGHFLLFFIDSLHECFTKETIVEISGLSKNETDNLAINVFKKSKSLFEKDYSEIVRLFHGFSVSQIVSTERENIIRSQNIEIYYTFDLHIPNENTTLYKCIEEYLKPEILDGDNKWFNEDKDVYERVEKKLLFWSFPDILIICLKRNNYFGGKNNSLIDYPLELDLSKYTCGYKKNSYTYDLIGVCNHIGNKNGGHYTAFVNKDNNWYHCNDETIQIVEDKKYLLTKFAYCLFYCKKNNSL